MLNAMAEPRPEVVAAGAEALAAAIAYIDGRNAELSTIALVPLYQRLERAVAALHEVTDSA